MEANEFLTKIEVALNIPAGHDEIPLDDRLANVLATIQRLSHVANHENMEMRILLNGLQDYMDVIEIDFDKFEDDKEEYISNWRGWQIAYANRPQRKTKWSPSQDM